MKFHFERMPVHGVMYPTVINHRTKAMNTNLNVTPPHPDNQDRESSEASVTGSRPGVLRGGAILTVQTHQAQSLVRGRQQTATKAGITGLFGFANLLRPIWHGARDDDPFADWWLIKIQDALEAAHAELDLAIRCSEGCLAAVDGIDIAPPRSVKPQRVHLSFCNPYAFLGARLLATYDRLIASLLSARHVGLTTSNDSERDIHLAGRDVRRAFQSPVGYRWTGITRDEVQNKTARALEAIEILGELPDDVLCGARRAAHAPAIAPTSAERSERFHMRQLAQRSAHQTDASFGEPP